VSRYLDANLFFAQNAPPGAMKQKQPDCEWFGNERKLIHIYWEYVNKIQRN